MIKGGILILGAGPAGMGAALELSNAGKAFTVIEKNTSIGGLARTLQYGDFRTDIGPHRFFSHNRYLYDIISDLLGERWIKVDRLTRFYVNGKFFLYPIELKNALFNVGSFKAFRIIFDLVLQKVKKILIRGSPVSFEDHVISDFGRTLAELNILNYTEKIWGLPPSEISPDWLKQRIKGLSLKEVLKKILIKSRGKSKSLISQFYYPDTGAGLIYEKIKETISDVCVLRLNSRPVKIIHDTYKIKKVVADIEGDEQVYKPTHVISSIPITEFVKLLRPRAPRGVLNAIKNLRFRSHVSLFITIRKPSVFPDQWIYFPDKEIPFGRISEPKNFSAKMSPADKTSLLVEFFCWKDDNIWKSTKKELFKLTMPWLEKFGFIKENDVIDYFVHREKYAYPVYDLKYRKNLKKIKKYLERFKNLHLIGRGGCFRYNNQDHAIEMGMLAARNVTKGKQYDIGDVGSEKEYFERGFVIDLDRR